MIFKSYEINDKTKYNTFLFYGENDGLKKVLIKKILNDEKNKIFKFEENDLINNTELIYNKISKVKSERSEDKCGDRLCEHKL